MNLVTHPQTSIYRGIANDDHRRIFRAQISEYCDYTLTALHAAEAEGTPLTLLSIVQRAHRRYSFRCHLADEAVLLAIEQLLPVTEAFTLVCAAMHLIPLLFADDEGARDRVEKAVAWLTAKGSAYPGLVTIAYEPNWVESRPRDRWMWTYVREKGPSISLELPVAIAAKTPVPEQTAKSSASGMILTQAQEKAVQYLSIYYRLTSERATAAGYRLRPPLLIGASGCGKTTAAQRMSLILGKPLLCYDMGSWMPQGSKAEICTLEAIRRALREHPSGVLIYLDELDKFTGRDHSWYATINQEVFALIDGRSTAFSGWTDSDRQLLASAFIFAAGTFQHLFRRRERALGFANPQDHDEAVDVEDQTIPEELLYRFGKPLTIHPPTAGEFAERISWIHSDLDVPSPAPEDLRRLVSEAVESRRGNRWLQLYAADLFIDQGLQPCGESPESPWEPRW